MEKRPAIEEYFTPEEINRVKNVMGYPERSFIVNHETVVFNGKLKIGKPQRKPRR